MKNNLHSEISKILEEHCHAIGEHNDWGIPKEMFDLFSSDLLALIKKHERGLIEEIRKWAKQKNNDADLVATSDLMRYLDSKIETLGRR